MHRQTSNQILETVIGLKEYKSSLINGVVTDKVKVC
jgi:hypothetical protein